MADDDDPPVGELEPVSPERLEHLRLLGILRRTGAAA